jgi:hypothetical protein
MQSTHLRWEVWVSDPWDGTVTQEGDWRFNACFDTRLEAEAEEQWYKRRRYSTQVRIRTTRYQLSKHITTGSDNAR